MLFYNYRNLFSTRLSLLLSVFISSLVLFGCSNEGSDSTHKAQNVQKIVRLDPNSAPLIPSQRKAKATDFSANLVNGKTFQLSNHTGEVVIINVWATWCSPCHTETPDFVDLYEEYSDDGLVIIGISMDEQGESVVNPFMEKYNVTYPIVIDRSGAITSKYGADMGIPTTYIIDPEGYLKYFSVGPLTKKELEPRIKKMLDLNGNEKS